MEPVPEAAALYHHQRTLSMTWAAVASHAEPHARPETRLYRRETVRGGALVLSRTIKVIGYCTVVRSSVAAIAVNNRRQASRPISCIGCALSLIHISEPTRLLSISYAVFCLK